jgi:hypothetical protein
MTNAELHAKIRGIVAQALRDQATATGSDELWNAPASEDVTGDIMALVNLADDDYTSESETVAILADPDTMDAIAEAENEAPNEMTVTYSNAPRRTTSPRTRLMRELKALVNKYQAAPSTLLAELEDFIRDNK